MRCIALWDETFVPVFRSKIKESKREINGGVPLPFPSLISLSHQPASIPHASLNHKPPRQRFSVGVNVRKKDCPGVNAMPHAASERWVSFSVVQENLEHLTIFLISTVV